MALYTKPRADLHRLAVQKDERRVQNFEFVVPVVVGTAAYYLGKKARANAGSAQICKYATTSCPVNV